MRTNRIFSIAIFSFLQEIKSRRFLILLLLFFIGAYLFVPPLESGKAGITIDRYRPIYNSAWLSAQLSIYSILMLWFFGFVFISVLFHHEEEFQLNPLFDTFAISRYEYFLGKGVAGYFVLGIVGFLGQVLGILLQLVQHENLIIDITAYLGTYFLLAVPVLGFSVSLVMLLAKVFWNFPTIGHMANIVIAVILFAFLQFQTYLNPQNHGFLDNRADPFGLGILFPDVSESLVALYPEANSTWISITSGIDLLDTFEWQGIAWNQAVISSRLWWMLFSWISILIVAGFPIPKKLFTSGEPVFLIDLRNLESQGPIREGTPREIYNPMFIGFKMMILEIPGWWGILLLITPMISSPLVWMLPITAISHFYLLEKKHGVIDLSRHHIRRIRHDVFIALFSYFLMVYSTIFFGVSQIYNAGMRGFISWQVGCIFTTCISFVIGTLFRSDTMNIIFFFLLWYGGVLYRIPLLDYVGITGQNRPEIFASIALIALLLALIINRFHSKARIYLRTNLFVVA